MESHEDTLLSKEAAQLLGISDRTLQDWRRRGVSPPFTRLDNGRVRYHRADVEAFKLLRDKAPEITGRKNKPELQKRLDHKNQQLQDLQATLEDCKAQLAQARQQQFDLQEALDQAKAETERRLSQKQHNLEQARQKWTQQNNRLEQTYQSYEQAKHQAQQAHQRNLELEQQLNKQSQLINTLMQTFFAENDDIATLYEKEAKRGRVQPRYVAGQATFPVSITEVRQRLLCLYSGLVVDKAGQIKPLGGRKPSQALLHERTMYGHKQG